MTVDKMCKMIVDKQTLEFMAVGTILVYEMGGGKFCVMSGCHLRQLIECQPSIVLTAAKLRRRMPVLHHRLNSNKQAIKMAPRHSA